MLVLRIIPNKSKETNMKQVLKMSAISTALLTLPMMANADLLASVKPLGFITSSIANGVTDTQVLVPAGASPHDYSLKLSDVQKVKSADLVLWVGEDIDAFLEKPISQIESKKVINISDIPEIKPLLSKVHHEHYHEGDEHEHSHSHDHKHDHKYEHGHDHDHHHHDVDENGLSVNWHLWYSPAISQIVAQTLYPDVQVLLFFIIPIKKNSLRKT